MNTNSSHELLRKSAYHSGGDIQIKTEANPDIVFPVDQDGKVTIEVPPQRRLALQ